MTCWSRTVLTTIQDHDHPEEDEDERPRASETGDVVGDALSESTVIMSCLQGRVVLLRVAPREPATARGTGHGAGGAHGAHGAHGHRWVPFLMSRASGLLSLTRSMLASTTAQIGRASCRERV